MHRPRIMQVAPEWLRERLRMDNQVQSSTVTVILSCGSSPLIVGGQDASQTPVHTKVCEWTPSGHLLGF